LIELWSSLRDQLKVELSPNVSEVSDKDSAVEVTFTVTNAASPQSVDQPEIVFENIVLIIETPKGSSDIELGSLSPTGSVTHTEKMAYFDLIDMKYDLAGTVSPDAFLRVRRNGSHGSAVGMTVQAYLQLFDELSIHGWLDSPIKSFPAPGPDTTLGQLTELAEPLNEAASEIRDAMSRLQRFAGLVTSGADKQNVSHHRGVAERYLEETMRGIGQIREALRDSDTRTLAGTLERVTTRLDREAAKVVETTNTLSDALLPKDKTGSNPGDATSQTQPEVANDDPKSEDDQDDGGYHEDAGRSPNDDRSDSMNPDNDAYQASMDNRSDQMNPNNPAYHSSRGGS
jgi:ubiquitin